MYERFFNYSNELFCIADKDANFIDANDAFCNLLGVTKNELLSKKYLEFIHEDDIFKTQNEIKKLSSGLSVISFENRYVSANGEVFVLSWRGYPDIENGEVFAIARDVTAERASISTHKQLYDSITDNVIFAKTNKRGIITEVNDKFCEISGYERSELIGKTHKVVNSGEHPTEFFKEIWQVITSGKVWTGAITNRRKNGERYIVQSIITPLYDLSGRIESYVAIRFDITDRIQSEIELENILKILNETGSMAKIGGWELDINTGDLSWTDETFKILGVKKEGSKTPNLPQGINLFSEQHKPIIDAAIQRGIEFGEPYNLELEVVKPDGGLKWVVTTGKPIYKNGKIVSLSGTIQDIHEKKITEMMYNQERQKSIQNAKFAALGELSASIAHEINNPLGIISAYTELLKLQENMLDNDKLDTILKSCERISYIVKNLKRFSRSDDVPVKKIIDLKVVAEEAISLTKPRVNRGLIKLSSQLLANSLVLGNDIEIEQVIINLVNNAIDAVQDDVNSWIKISLMDLGDYYKLEVEDSGKGIPDEIQIRMFEPFYTTKDINKGTGLGLSVIRGILDDHKASIEFDSSRGNSCFSITFPKYYESN